MIMAMTQQEVRRLFVNDGKGKKTLFIDRGVYTRSRNFR